MASGAVVVVIGVLEEGVGVAWGLGCPWGVAGVSWEAYTGGGMKESAGFPTDFRLYEIALIPIFCEGSVGGVVEAGGRGEVLEGRAELTTISDTSLVASTPVSSM